MDSAEDVGTWWFVGEFCRADNSNIVEHDERDDEPLGISYELLAGRVAECSLRLISCTVQRNIPNAV